MISSMVGPFARRAGSDSARVARYIEWLGFVVVLALLSPVLAIGWLLARRNHNVAAALTVAVLIGRRLLQWWPWPRS